MVSLEFKDIDWGGWLKVGAIAGLFWIVLVLLISFLLAVAVGLVSLAIIGFAVAGVTFIPALIILGVIVSAVRYAGGRFITQIIGFQSDNDYWRIFQVGFTGSILFSLLSWSLSLVSVMIGVMGSLITAWAVIKIYKFLNWELPND